MSKQVIFNPSTFLSDRDSLLITLFLAAIIHIIIILGINFTAPEPDKVRRSIEITLVNTPVKQAPNNAKFLAPENQIGAGEKTKKPEPPKQQLPSEGNRPTAKPVKKSAPEESQPKAAQKILTQQKAEKKIVAVSKPKPDVVKQEIVEKRPQLSPETLHQQIAQLGTEIRQSQQSADDSNIKFVSEVSAHKYLAAQYMKDWESKVERVGNLNYPAVAAKKNFSGSLTMDVTINADGSIHKMIVKRSSGNPALDEAAKRIVLMSAPFAPLPIELLKELNPKILGITRIWKFSDESGMSTR